MQWILRETPVTTTRFSKGIAVVTKSVLFCTLLFSISVKALATEWYVDGSVADSGDGTTWETAFKTIQGGIDEASVGDTVIVAEGTYVENIRFNGKNIILRSTDPTEAGVVENTIIDGNQAGSVVTFAGTENETCVLSGFTIRNGSGSFAGGICGGRPDNRSHATIQKNVICDNSAGIAGGLAFCDGAILNNIICRNSAIGALTAGALAFCDGTIQNNVLSRNSATGMLHVGGLSQCHGTIRNCIVWGNQEGDQLYECSLPTYSCIRGWTGGGEGNIHYYPYFVDAPKGDYHLKSWSPCIDAGDPTCAFSKEPEPDGGRINMGAYGNTPQATCRSPDSDGDTLPDDWEVEFFGDLAEEGSGDSDRNGVSNIEEYYRGTSPIVMVRHVDGSVELPGDGASWETAFKKIQEGMDAADEADVVIVAEGTYIENIHFKGKNIVLRSTEPLDPDVVEKTVIDANQAGSVVTFSGSEDERCVISGFTIKNGKSSGSWSEGGGIRGWETHATIQNNVITGNLSEDGGGGVADCDGIIQNNVISGNAATAEYSYGGGVHDCDGTIQNNIITGNRAEWSGGGLSYCHGGTIQDNTITGNSAYGGGGLDWCKGTIQNNIISGNWAPYGGGLDWCEGVIQNNIIAGNEAVGVYSYGGGLCYCGGIVQNNTITRNWANYGSAFYGCVSAIQNCIIWENTSVVGGQLWQSSVPRHSCIQFWAGGGEGNTGGDPRFVDPDGADNDPTTYEDNNYRLSAGSPCIDVGMNYYWFAWPIRDMDGNCRLVGERVDMGCYEYNASADVDGDLLSDVHELALGTELNEDDTNGDGLRDGLEVLHGSNPLAPGPSGVLHVPSDVPSIQRALCVAVNGAEIIVAPGTYRENIHFSGADVILRSSNCDNPAAVKSTIIDGGGIGPAVSFMGSESEACILAGFTIRNGKASAGGGIYGGTWFGDRTHATIRNNVIAGNRAEWCGGGLYGCDGPIHNNTVCRHG